MKVKRTKQGRDQRIVVEVHLVLEKEREKSLTMEREERVFGLKRAFSRLDHNLCCSVQELL